VENISLKLDAHGKGAFVIDEGDERLAEMVIGISGNNMTVYHTHVSEKLKGKGVASQLLKQMVTYAREHQLKVIALCPYVSAQFKRHPEEYQDVWNQHWH
jgi:predicted GNAT family acetyltransferase